MLRHGGGHTKVIDIVFVASFVFMWVSLIFQQTLPFVALFSVFIMLFALKNKQQVQKVIGKVILGIDFILTKFQSQKNSKYSTGKNNLLIGITKPIVTNKSISALASKFNPQLEKEIATSGRAHSPRMLTQKSIAYMVFSAIVIIPIAIAGGIFADDMFFVLVFLPVFFLFYPKIKLKFVVSERKSSIDDELAFFVNYAGVMQSIGRDIFRSLTDVLNKNVFPTLEAEGKMLERNVNVFSMDHLSAVNELGMTHPNPSFKNLLLGYVSIARSGGDLARYMERKSEEFFNKMQFKYASYKNQAGIISELMLILLTILPTLILMSSFLLAEESVRTMMGLSFVLVPVITLIIIMLVNLSQPKIRNVVDFKIVSFLIGGAAAAICIITGQPGWMVMGVTISVTALGNYVLISRQLKEISYQEAALPDFFRDVTEYIKIGYSIPNIVIKLARERHYNPYFDALLSSIAYGLIQGEQLIDVLDSARIRSWITRTSLFVLGKIAESGGGTPAILEQITNFTTNINTTRKETIASISAIAYVSLSSPVLLSFTTKEMTGIINRLNSGLGQMEAAAFNIQTAAVSPEMLSTVNFLNIIIGLSIGLVMGKITAFSLKNTLWIGMATLVSILSIILMPYLPTITKF